MEKIDVMAHRTRVAHIIGKWLGGGVEAVVMNYYRHIDRDNIQFDFICDRDSTDISREEVEKLGGRVILVPPYQDISHYQRELRRVFSENHYRIVHSHINTLSVFPLCAAKKVGVPIRIAHSHSTTNKKEWKKNLIKQALRPYAKLFATDYLACSEHAGRWLFGNRSFESGEVTILRNAIDLDKFKFDQKARQRIRKELKISDDALVLGHVGRFVAQKNQTFLVDIFKAVHDMNPNSVLILIGQGPDEARIKEKVEELGLSGQVMFLGQRNDIRNLYSTFDVFVLPSLYEGLSVAGIEAQACGLPCLFSDAVPDEAKILKSVNCVSLNASGRVWAETILNKFHAEANHDVDHIMTDNGYNIKQEARKLERIYSKLLSEQEKGLCI